MSSLWGDNSVGTIPKWPDRLATAPSRDMILKSGIDLFEADARRWSRRVAYYKNSMNMKLATRATHDVMATNAFFGGFAGALSSDPVWVMNVIPACKPLTV